MENVDLDPGGKKSIKIVKDESFRSLSKQAKLSKTIGFPNEKARARALYYPPSPEAEWNSSSKKIFRLESPNQLFT